MSLRTLQLRLKPLHHLHQHTATALLTTNPYLRNHQRRSFLTSNDPPERLTAQRTLPYSTLGIFDIITNIESYPDFLPFLTSSHITSWSTPDSHYGRKWPHIASLKVGYKGQFEEEFTSTVYCMPPIPEKGRAGVGIVEAVSGNAQCSLDADSIQHYKAASSSQTDTNGPMEYLRTRWTVRQFPFKPGAETNPPAEKSASSEIQERTDVGLSIEFRFANPLYEALAKAGSGRVAELMIQAFEKRVEEVLKKNGGAAYGTGTEGKN